jgi:sugar phosphate permease
MNEKLSTFQKYLIITILATAGGILYKVTYLKEVFYDEIITALSLTNTQLGLLSSVVGTVAMISYFIGGYVADKVKARYLVSFSCIGAGLMTFWYAALPSFQALILIHGVMAMCGILTFWPAYIRVIRFLGGKKSQGRFYGIAEGVRSIMGMVLSFGSLWIVARIDDIAGSLQATLIYYGVLYIITGLLAFFFIKEVRDESAAEKEEEPKVTLSAYLILFKQPGLWLVSLLVFGTYCIFALQSYTTPYLTGVCGVSTAAVGTVAILRQYGIGLLSMPIAGFIADKMGSPTKTSLIGLILLFFSALGLLMLPAGASPLTAIVLVLALGFFVSGVRGIYYATMNEARIPVALTGTAVGIISTIGFMPDAFIFTQVGRWLDAYTAEIAYNMIFRYMLITITVAFAAGIGILILARKASRSSEPSDSSESPATSTAAAEA